MKACNAPLSVLDRHMKTVRDAGADLNMDPWTGPSHLSEFSSLLYSDADNGSQNARNPPPVRSSEHRIVIRRRRGGRLDHVPRML
jgi:hypothetical protein